MTGINPSVSTTTVVCIHVYPSLECQNQPVECEPCQISADADKPMTDFPIPQFLYLIHMFPESWYWDLEFIFNLWLPTQLLWLEAG